MHSTNKARFALALSLVLALAACGKKDAAPADSAAVTMPTPSTAPLRVTDIQLGKSVGADRRVISPTTTFGTRDTIYVSINTEGAANDARLTATWMYNNSQGISEADEMVTSTGSPYTTEFHIAKNTPWPTGSYSVDVKLNGTSVGKREFRIQ